MNVHVGPGMSGIKYITTILSHCLSFAEFLRRLPFSSFGLLDEQASDPEIDLLSSKASTIVRQGCHQEADFKALLFKCTLDD